MTGPLRGGREGVRARRRRILAFLQPIRETIRVRLPADRCRQRHAREDAVRVQQRRKSEVEPGGTVRRGARLRRAVVQHAARDGAVHGQAVAAVDPPRDGQRRLDAAHADDRGERRAGRP